MPTRSVKPVFPRGRNRRSILGQFRKGNSGGPGRRKKGPVLVYFDRRALEFTSGPEFWRDYHLTLRRMREAAARSRDARDWWLYFQAKFVWSTTRAYGQPRAQPPGDDDAAQRALSRTVRELMEAIRTMPEGTAAQFLALASGDGDLIDVTPGLPPAEEGKSDA